MNTVTVASLTVPASVLLIALGYLLARSRWHEQQGRAQVALRLAEERLDQAGAQVRELRVERDAARDVLHDREITLAGQTAKLQDLTERFGRLDGDFKAAQEKLQRADHDLALLQEALRTSQQRVREQDGELERAGRAEAELRGGNALHEQAINEYKTELAELHAQRATLEQQQAEVAAARKQLEEIRSEHSRLQAEQIEATVAKMLSASQDKLVTTADDKLGAAARAVTDKLLELDQHLREFDGKRTETETRLDEQLKNLADEHVRGRKQTEALVMALRKPQVRGQWGELQLKRAVEMANMREHCDFEQQVHVDGDAGAQRPDMVVRLSNGRNIVIDAKVSLEAFLSALEAEDDAERDQLMGEHARQVRKHVDTLAAKEYYEKVAGSPDFVLMFLPSEALLQAALDKDAQLYEYALKKRVVIASPTVLIPMLRTIEIGWTETALQENMRKVHELGQAIHSRLGTLGGHLHKLGRSLDTSVKAYNATIGSLEGNVLPAARRFKELKILSDDLAQPVPVESMTRSLKAVELVQPDPAGTLGPIEDLS